LESGLKLAIGVGGTSRPAAGCADQFIDGDVVDLELKILRSYVDSNMGST
jgi:hypothetical protein